MIERKRLGLREITFEAYEELMRRVGKAKDSGLYRGTEGFAEITEPLIYRSYKELLVHFLKTDGARKASAMIEPGRWLEYPVRILDEETINLLVKNAVKNGFLYLSFYNQTRRKQIINDEIGFEPIKQGESRVVSVSLKIPSNERGLYNWNGSQEKYRIIIGVYAQFLLGKICKVKE